MQLPPSYRRTSTISSSRRDYTHAPSSTLHGCHTVNLHATLWWNPTKSLQMSGYITHVPNPYKRTAFTTAMQNIPDVQEISPSLPNNRVRSEYFFCNCLRLCTTTRQLSSAANRDLPMYLKEDTGVKGLLQVMSSVAAPVLASSSSSRRRFRSSPCWQISVEGCRIFRSHCETNVSHLGQCWFPYPSIKIVTRTWLCKKWCPPPLQTPICRAPEQ